MMIVGFYLLLIPLFQYVVLLVAAILVVMILTVLALKFWNQVKELTADEEPASKQRLAEETETLYNRFWSWNKKN